MVKRASVVAVALYNFREIYTYETFVARTRTCINWKDGRKMLSSTRRKYFRLRRWFFLQPVSEAIARRGSSVPDAYLTRVNSAHELIILDAHRSDAYVRFYSAGAVLYAGGMNNRISMSVLGLRKWAETGNRARGRRETETAIERQIQNPISMNRVNSASTVDPNTTRHALSDR